MGKKKSISPETFETMLDRASLDIMKMYPLLPSKERARAYLLTRNCELKGFIHPETLYYHEIKPRKRSFSLSKKSKGHIQSCLFPKPSPKGYPTISVGIQRGELIMHGYRTIDFCDGDFINVCLLRNPTQTAFSPLVERLLRLSYPSLPWHIEYFPDQQQDFNLCEIDSSPRRSRLLVFYMDGNGRPVSFVEEYEFVVSESQNATKIQVHRPNVPECFIWIIIETELGHLQSRVAWVHSKYQFLNRYGNININAWKEYIENDLPVRIYQPNKVMKMIEDEERRILTVDLSQFLLLHLRDEMDIVTDDHLQELSDQLKDKHGVQRSVEELREDIVRLTQITSKGQMIPKRR